MRHKRGCRRGTHAGRGALLRSADPLQLCGRGAVDCRAQATGLSRHLGPTTQPPVPQSFGDPTNMFASWKRKSTGSKIQRANNMEISLCLIKCL